MLEYLWGLLQYFRNQWDVEMVRRLEHPQGDIEMKSLRIWFKARKKCDRNYSLTSVQLKSEDELIESRLFTLQLKVWVKQWDLNLLSSDIFINDVKNLLKTWRTHKNKTRKKGKGMYMWNRGRYIWRMGTAWRVGSGVLRRVAMIHVELCGIKEDCEN